MEAAAADQEEKDLTKPSEDGEPYLRPVRPNVQLDEAASPTSGRRFTRT